VIGCVLCCRIGAPSTGAAVASVYVAPSTTVTTPVKASDGVRSALPTKLLLALGGWLDVCLDGALIRRAKVLPSTCVCLIYAAKYINTFLIMSFTISIPICAHKSLIIKCRGPLPRRHCIFMVNFEQNSVWCSSYKALNLVPCGVWYPRPPRFSRVSKQACVCSVYSEIAMDEMDEMTHSRSSSSSRN
jgi:hypothetical protein